MRPITIQQFPERIRGATVLLLGNGPSGWSRGFVPSSAVARLRARGTPVLFATCNGAWQHFAPDLAFAVDREPAMALLARCDLRVTTPIVVERYAEEAKIRSARPLHDYACGAGTGQGAAWYLAACGAAHVILAGFDGPLDADTLFGAQYPEKADRNLHWQWCQWLLASRPMSPSWPRWTLVLASDKPHPLDALPARRIAPTELEALLAAVAEPRCAESSRISSPASQPHRAASSPASVPREQMSNT